MAREIIQRNRKIASESFKSVKRLTNLGERHGFRYMIDIEREKGLLADK